jgi:RNase P subunit RPR2
MLVLPQQAGTHKVVFLFFSRVIYIFLILDSSMDLNKKQTQEKIRDFFKSNHSSEQVKKIKKLAMHHKIRLKDNKKLFCKKCYSMNLKVLGIKNKVKRIACKDCNSVMRWKVS